MKLQINKNKTKLLAVRFEEETVKELLDIAKKEDVPITAVIRAMVNAVLKEIK